MSARPAALARGVFLANAPHFHLVAMILTISLGTL